MLSYRQGYLAMFDFLDKYWEETKLDDLGGLLGSMNIRIWKRGMPIDNVMFTDWLAAVKRDGILKEELSIEEAFDSMLYFIINIRMDMKLEIQPLINFLIETNNSRSENKYWTRWIDCCLSQK